MNTNGLTAPGDVQVIDEGSIAGSVRGGGHVANAPTWGVGDPVATALSGLSDMVDKYAKAYDDVVVNDYTMQKSKELDELYNNPDTGIFNTRKGDAAKGAYQDYKSTIRDMWDKDARDNLTDRQRGLASRHLYTLFSSYGHRVAEFETKELMGAQVERCKNTVQNAQDLIATGRATDDDIANAMNAIRIAYENMGEMQGWDAETVARNQMEAMSASFTKASAALATVDPIAAAGLLEANRAFMTPAAYAGAMQALDGELRTANRETYYQLEMQGKHDEAEAYLRANTASAFAGAGLWIPPKKPRTISLPQNVDAKLVKTAQAEGVDPNLVRAIAMQESGGRQSVRSNKGAVGVMQVMPQDVNDFGGGNPYNEDDNIRIGVREIKKYLRQYNGNLEYALIAYNWGPGNLESWLKTGKGKKGLPMPEETRKYIPSVMSMMGRTPGQVAPQGGEYQPRPGALKPSEADSLRLQAKSRIDTARVEAACEVLNGMDRNAAKQKLMTLEGQQSLGLDAEQAARAWNKMNPLWKAMATQEITGAVKGAIDTVKGESLDKRDGKAIEFLRTQFTDDTEFAQAVKDYQKQMKQYDDAQLAESWAKLKPIIEGMQKQRMTNKQIYLEIMGHADKFSDYDRMIVDRLAKSPKNNSVSQAHVGRIMRGANAKIQEGKDTQEILAWAEEEGFGNVTATQAKDIQKYIEKGGVVAGVSLARCEKIYKRLASAKGKNVKGKSLDDLAYALILSNLDPNETSYTDDKLARIIADIMITEQPYYKWYMPNDWTKRTPYEAFKAGEENDIIWEGPEVQAYRDEYKKRTGLDINADRAGRDLAKKHVKSGWRVEDARRQ